MTAEPLPQRPEARSQRTGLRMALAALAAAGTRPVTDRPAWDRDIVAALGELRSALARHAAFTQGPDGLFAEVREVAPRLLHRVERLEGDHDELGAAIDRCRTEVGEQDDAAAAALVASVVEGFEQHLHRGVQLVYDAYNVDISPGD